jgi:hypothetical protein
MKTARARETPRVRAATDRKWLSVTPETLANQGAYLYELDIDLEAEIV